MQSSTKITNIFFYVKSVQNVNVLTTCECICIGKYFVKQIQLNTWRDFHHRLFTLTVRYELRVSDCDLLVPVGDRL